MGIAERKLRQKEEVRASILKAAWAIVKADGWQALSIRRVADAIEYSVPVIYDHFQNKEAILFEFTRRGFEALNETLEAAIAAHRKPATQLHAIAEAYWGFAFKNSEYYQLMYGLGMPSCDTVRQIPELARFTQLIDGPVRQLIAESENSTADAWLKLHTFWSMLHGLISINMMGKEHKKENLQHAVLQDLVQSFIKGISG